VVDGKVKLTDSAFWGISGGLLFVSELKAGRVTLARLSNTGDRYSLHMVTGTAKPRAWEEAGWEQPAPQLPSFELTLDTPVEGFAENISGQHYIIAYGDHLQLLKDFCYLKNINVI
jgi:L-fucose isomerase-like protein